MLIPKDGKAHQVTVWWLLVIQLKTRGGHFRCKVTNKCLNVWRGVN